ncbi:ATP-grasp domain-containing protein, partial [Halomonas sp. AOP35-4E-18]|uniref:ATP-grasp domain-containing protein n=1 Tax=Halomonas sp. AOP35-4E-18 TaxID=3457686 RepID=UPI00403412A9
IGIVKAKDQDELLEAYNDALQYDKLVMVEEFVKGNEYTVAVVSGEALPVIGMVPSNDFYDYEAKYQSSGTVYNLPCGLELTVEERLKELSKKAYDMIGCEGWGRVDMIVDDTGMPWLIEINTCPGMTERSLVPQAAKHAGTDFDTLVMSILETASLKAL